MKRFIIYLLLALFLFALFGCAVKPDMTSQPSSANSQTSVTQSALQNNAQESTSAASIQITPEVPESVVLLTSEIMIDTADRYALVHNYDEVAHIDNVEFSLYHEGPYGVLEITHNLWYQYDQSNDTWSLIKKNDAATRKYIIDEIAYILSPPWEGRHSNPQCNYSIVFDGLDMITHTATISYTIDFDDSQITDISECVTVSVDDMGGEYAPFLAIEYEYPGYENNHKDEMTFLLTYDGLEVP